MAVNNKEKNKKSRLEAAKELLYRRGYEPEVSPRRIGRAPEITPSGGWNPEPEQTTEKPTLIPKGRFPYVVMFLAAAGFFLVSLLVAYFLISGGGSVVSPENIEIQITGPSSASGGEEVSLQVEVNNKNSQKLELVDLVMSYPPGTGDPRTPGKPLERSRIGLGDIAGGGSKTELARAVFYGEEGAPQEILATIEYRIPGSNAIFEKTERYELILRSTPASVVIKTVSSATANQRLDMTVEITSNSPFVLPNMLLKMEYPFGFEPERFEPQPLAGNSLWRIGDLPAGGKARVRISGVIKGQENEEKIFRGSVGAATPSNDRAVGTIYGAATAEVTLEKAFVGVEIALNGDTATTISADGGAKISGVLSYTNNLPIPVGDVVVALEFSGTGFERTSVTVDRGFYDSSAQKIVWDKKTYTPFASLDPGESGRLSFQFSTKSLAGSSLKNLSVGLLASVKARRSGEAGASEENKEADKRTVNIRSDLQLSSRAVYSIGPFENSGPLPPVAEQPTTYTILWTVVNTGNDVSGLKVRGTLPSYVTWTGRTQGDGLSFNPATGEVSWDIAGRIPAGTGIGTQSLEGAFQVRLLPSVNQVGSVPELVRAITFEAFDEFTRGVIRRTKPAVTTTISADPVYGGVSGRVVRESPAQ